MTLQKAELPVSLMKWRIKFRLLSGVSENMVLRDLASNGTAANVIGVFVFS
jgi:hypothetical protein